METPLEFATALAYRIGELLNDHFQKVELETHLKGDHTVVTEADLAADRLIAQEIKARYPNDLLLSEELRPELETGQGPQIPAVWIIDPLDGTTNFSLGLHYWGVSIGRLVNGRPDSAALYFPQIDELYTAQRGQGAFLNHIPIHTEPPQANNPASFFACCSRTYRRYRVSIPYKLRILGSAAYNLCAVASGMAVVGFEATPKVWDIAAAWLVVEEAGGTLISLHERQPFPLDPGLSYGNTSFPLLTAATAELAERSLSQIKPLS